MRGGLTVEQVKQKKKPVTVGPLLDANQASDPRLLAAIVSAAATAGSNSSSSNANSGGNGGGGAAGNSGGLTLVKVGDKYQFQKGGVGGTGNFRFCFARISVDNSAFTIQSTPTEKMLKIPLVVAYGMPVQNFTVKIDPQSYCGTESPPPGSATGTQYAAEGVIITTRSLEGIFQYLGQIVRTELGLGTGRPTSLAIPRNEEEAEKGEGFRLFRLQIRAPSLTEPWVFYDGNVYTIAVDPSGQADASSRVIQLVSDLLSLQSSAKALPVPNLIAISP
jgi:hypothetical protein